MARKKIYRLYAAPFSADALNALRKAQYCRASGDYILVYTSRKLPEGVDAIEIKDEDAKQLTAAEAEWLFDCNVEILKAETQARSGEILKDLSVKIGNLEAALRAEMEKETQKGEDDG
jgi:hypothetical protein